MTPQELIDLIEKHKVDEKIYLFQYCDGEDDAFASMYPHSRNTNLRVVGEVLKPQGSSYGCSYVNSADVIHKEGIYECSLLRKAMEDEIVHAFVWWDRSGNQRGRVISINDTVGDVMECMTDFLERKDS